MQKSQLNNKHEECVCCGKQLDVLVTTPISQRECYVIGAGQLCKECYYPLLTCNEDSDIVINEKQIEYLLNISKDSEKRDV